MAFALVKLIPYDSLVLFSSDAVALDLVTRRLESCTDVRKEDVFITTHIDYLKGLIIKEIDKKINDAKRRSLNVKRNSKNFLLKQKCLEEKIKVSMILYCLIWLKV
jgi:hypothetical protein